MFSNNQAFYQLRDELEMLYDTHEATAIAHDVLHHITGLNKMQRLMNKDQALRADQEIQFINFKAKLLKGTPLQYVLGSTLFMGHDFKVNEHVLIPRPETEELVQWIISENHEHQKDLSILDVGTGSGCIPISLKLAMLNTSITSCDISNQALDVAKNNAIKLDTNINFLHLDFIKHEMWNRLPHYDIIVSNPPYIPLVEKEKLHVNVRDHEPALALFVPSEDPLIFYKSLAAFGRTHLNKKGCIYCELHVDHALETKKLFQLYGYTHVEVRKDMQGNNRMLKAY
ncbi:MAG: peptide chain release factor N(5)-glutamine methyltransferase [Bacteroidota bacterium]